MIMAETPIRSNVLILYTKCSINPPVSPSKIIGLVVTSIISLMVFSLDVVSTSSISGFPFAVESHKLDTQIASNCLISSSFSTFAFSTIKPVIPLCASNTRSGRSVRRSARFNFPRRISGI